MSRLFDIVTFDCYGTLIDWNAGIGSALVGVAAEGGMALDREVLLAAYHELEPMVEAEAFRPYRDVLQETARRTMERFGRALPPQRAHLLPESLPNWLPFPDTNAALERLHAAGYRLGILSNVDDDLIAGTRRHFTVPFELVVTAQQVGSYKPAQYHFETARRSIGNARWLHAAQSYVHDVVPARAQSIPVAWINRLQERPVGDARPDREFHSLAELADWLAPA